MSVELNPSREKANQRIREIAEDRDVPFYQLIEKAARCGLWIRLATAFHREEPTEKIEQEINNIKID